MTLLRFAMNWASPLSIGVLVLSLTGPSGLEAAVMFNFNYQDGVGMGFNDTTLGATRRATLQQAADALGGYFQQTATVTLDVNSFNLASYGTLAYAGSDLTASGPGFYRTILQEKIITNGANDPNGATADGTVTFNFGQPWDYSDAVSAVAYDFKSTAIHELAHALGFLSQIDSSGRGAQGSPTGTPDAWGIFDSWLTDHAGAALVNGATFAFDTSKLGVLTGGSANGVFFSGPNARAAFGGLPVPIYSPNPYEDGSSGTHTDDNTFTGAGTLLMNAATDTGPGLRTLSGIELGLFQDLGYAVVPEPGTTVLLLAGLAALRCRFRPRRD